MSIDQYIFFDKMQEEISHLKQQNQLLFNAVEQINSKVQTLVENAPHIKDTGLEEVALHEVEQREVRAKTQVSFEALREELQAFRQENEQGVADAERTLSELDVFVTKHIQPYIEPSFSA